MAWLVILKKKPKPESGNQQVMANLRRHRHRHEEEKKTKVRQAIMVVTKHYQHYITFRQNLLVLHQGEV